MKRLVIAARNSRRLQFGTAAISPETIMIYLYVQALVQILTKGTLKETEGYIVYEGQETSPNDDDVDRKAKDGLDLVKNRRLVFAQNPTLTQVSVCVYC